MSAAAVRRRPRVAIVHDYLTQRGGAERVVLAMAAAFPGAPVHTSLYAPATTFPEFADLDVRPLWTDRVPGLAARHRLAAPILAPAFASARVDADVVLCSSSGWAHGVSTTGRRVVYCHTPARWLYVEGQRAAGPVLAGAGERVLRLAGGPLRAWDRRAARGAARYLANSRQTARRVAEVYGIDAEVVPPPVAVDVDAERRPVPGLTPGFALVVARLQPYKHVDVVAAAFRALPDLPLVVVGQGPELGAVRAAAPPSAHILSSVSDAELRWLYASARVFVSAAHEDFGLTPLEAAAFGVPSVVRRVGGFVETVVDGETGVTFDGLHPAAVAAAVRRATAMAWDPDRLRAEAGRYDPLRFGRRLREVVDEVDDEVAEA